MFSIVVIYRPPPLKTRQDFLSEVDHLISIVSLRYNQIYLCRDLNLRFEKSEDEIARQFLDYIADFKFDYHVQRGGSLDVICTQGLSCVSHSIEDIQLSDHHLLFSTIGISTKRDIPASHCVRSANPRYYDYRNFKLLENPAFVQSVASRYNELSIPGHDANYVAQFIVDRITESLDDFAPVSRRRTKKKVRSNFVYNKEVADAKQIRRQYERQFLRLNQKLTGNH